MAPTLPIGTSDFRKIRRDGSIYVDKTRLIGQVMADPAAVLVLPRPRRFGKTTNLSMLRYFLQRSPEDLGPLFAGLSVWQDAEARQHFQRYPLLFLTFKDLKAPTFAECVDLVRELVAQLYDQHRDLLDSGTLSEREAAVFRLVQAGQAGLAQLQTSLRYLSSYLHRRHGQEVVILIDEYDTPLHAAFAHGYFDEAIGLFRGLLSGCLKDNEALRKGVLTGILRVAKESIFSDLNNLIVHSLLSSRFADAFGFTEDEVRWLAAQTGFAGPLDELREWYNGYRFGDTVIYNPWSVLSALDRGHCEPYWVNTSGNELIHRLLLRASAEQHQELQALLQGGSVRKPLLENIVLREIDREPEALWSFLLFSGYLKAEDVQRSEDGVISGDLRIPNRELRLVFTSLFSNWLAAALGGQRQVEALAQALLSADTEGCERHLSHLLESASYLDLAGAAGRVPPEQVYHVFLLGLLLHLQPRYLLRSNREAGHGRADVLLVPRERGAVGVVLELKVRRKGQTLSQVLAQGLQQLAEQDYAAELRALGAGPVHELVIALSGKRVRVQRRTA